MHSLLILILLVALLIILGRSADLVVSSSLSLGRALRLREFTIGLLVLGFATSSPEIMVGLNAAVEGVPQLSLGNLLGANITLLSLLAGVSVFMRRRVRQLARRESKQIIVASIVILSPVLLFFDGMVSRADGALLILFYLSYLLLLQTPATAGTLVKQTFNNAKLRRAIIELIGGIVLLVLISKAVVELALDLAANLSVPAAVVGLVVLSVGTNLPELSLTMSAKKSYRSELILGDLLGSASVNTFVLGMVALFSPIVVMSRSAVSLAVVFMVAVIFLFNYFARTERKLSRREGAVLIGIYFMFLASQAILEGF